MSLFERFLKAETTAANPTDFLWEIIETSLRTDWIEWQICEAWVINPTRNLAIYTKAGREGLKVDPDGPGPRTEVDVPANWQRCIWEALEILKARKMADRFRTKVDYSPEGIAAWLERRAQLFRDRGRIEAANALEMAALCIKDGEIEQDGTRRGEDWDVLSEPV